jgi:photosystem II stability/assembly factor-like uncharacterized protein
MFNQIHYFIMRYFYLFLLGIALSFQSLLAQWKQQTSNAVDNLVDIVMLDSVTAIAIGDRNAILRTTDAGENWINETIILSATFHWNSISFSDKLYGTIVGNQTIWRTTNGGINWINCVIESNKKFFSVYQMSESEIWVGADSGYLFHSNDSGQTWTSKKIGAWEIRDFFYYRGFIQGIYGITIFALTPHSICRYNNVDDVEWSEDTLDLMLGFGSEMFHAEYCKGGGDGFIVGVSGDKRYLPIIFRGDQWGFTWNSVGPSNIEDGILYDVSAPSANIIYTCGTNGMILKTVDGGDNWSQCQSTTYHSLKSIFFFDNKRGFAVGDSGTILYTGNGGDIAVDVKEQFETPLKFEIKQNYPNPFNPTTIFSFSLPSKEFASLKVYDLLGREVATLVDEERSAGEHFVQWNASSFSSGIYIYRLEARKFVETKKLLLMK